MDDPCYVWAAQHIQSHPLDPYGFNVNWCGFIQPMWVVTQNPPVMSYYLAAAALVFGWSEIGMHIACLLLAVAVIFGTYRLAKSFCRQPHLAAVIVLFATGFLVAATTVMCDVAVLAFWIWSVVFWTEGMRENNFKKMTAAGLLAALALLTKYNGISLLPLLAAYGWLKQRSPGRWFFFLLIPVAAFGAYEWLTCQLYGRGLFSAAVLYAKSAQGSLGVSKMTASLNALTFIGGGFSAVLFCAPFLWRKQILILLSASTGVFVTLTFADGLFEKNYDWLAGGVRISVAAQIFFWSLGGVSVLALAVANVWRKGDAEAWLLVLWVLGTFVFAAFFNWTVNLRSLLPMAPAVAILMVRRLEQHPPARPRGIKFSIAATAVLSLLVAQADFQLAGVVRKGAEQVCAKYAAGPGTLWFQGHWGFQFYMQSLGARPMDFKNPKLQPGDILVIPNQNSNVIVPDPQNATQLEVFALPVFPGLADWSPRVGASFYSTGGGPLPFAFGRIPPDKLFVYVVK